MTDSPNPFDAIGPEGELEAHPDWARSAGGADEPSSSGRGGGRGQAPIVQPAPASQPTPEVAPAPTPAAAPTTAAPHPDGDEPNLFDALLGDVELEAPPSGFMAGLHEVERQVLPTIAAAGSFGPGAAGGAAVGAFGGPLAPLTVPGGALIGGLAASFGAGYATSKAQGYAVSKLPQSWREAVGQDDATREAEARQHPDAVMLGGFLPMTLMASPGGLTRAVGLAQNSTALQRLMANPVTARMFGGTLMGGMELGQEKAEGAPIDWRRVAAATAFGTVFNKPTRFGEAIETWGGRLGRGVTPEAAPAVDAAATNAPTLAEAGDLKVMGPGVTEEVFRGDHVQDPQSAMVAQDAARTEANIVGPPAPGPDLHDVARRIDPETFGAYDALTAQRDTFRARLAEAANPPDDVLQEAEGRLDAIQAQLDAVPTSGAGRNLPEARRLRAQVREAQRAVDGLNERRAAYAEGRATETPETAALRQQLQAVDYGMRDLAPQVASAYRMAADHAAADTVPAVPHPPDPSTPSVVPEQFRSMAEMLAARDQQGTRPAASPADATPAQPTATMTRSATASDQVPNPAPSPPSRPATEPVPLTASDIEQQREFIAADVARQLIAAGRPEQEARANGRLNAAYYVTRATRMGGALGTPEDLYRQTSPAMVAPDGRRIPGPAGRTGGANPSRPTEPPIAAPAPLMPTLEQPTIGRQATPAVAGISAPVTPEPAPKPAGVPAGGIEALDPRDIGIDAARFQFKAGGDARGVTERLQGVTTWDPRLAGTALVFRDAEGKNWVADGHQRVGLAQRLTADTNRASAGRLLMEMYVNGLISGPVTHTTYAIGNTILTANRMLLELPTAATVGALRRAYGGEGGVRPGEVGAQLRGAAGGLAPALQSMFDAYRTGATTLLPGEGGPAFLPFAGRDFTPAATMDERANLFSVMQGLVDGVRAAGGIARASATDLVTGARGGPLVGLQRDPAAGYWPNVAVRGVTVLPVGDVIRFPGRNVAAIHSFFRSMNYSIDKAGIAYRTAANEGLTGQDLAARVADIHANPTDAVMEQARSTATNLTLMGQGGEFVKRLSALLNWTPDVPGIGPVQPLRFIDPFVKISGNVMGQALMERTPIGAAFSPEIRASLAGKNGPAAQDLAVGRMVAGTALATTFGLLAQQGLVTGSGPQGKDEQETRHLQAMWRLAGNQAHSVRLGDLWYDVHRLGPLGMLMGVAADLSEIGSYASDGDLGKAGGAVMHAFTQNILDESFVKGPADLIEAVQDPARYGPSYIRNQLAGFVPYSTALAQMARAGDPYSREARSVVDTIKAKIPGLSETLLPKRNIWGMPMPARDALGGPYATAIYQQRADADPLAQAMLDIGVYPAPVERRIRGVELSDAQHDDFARIAGGLLHNRMSKMVRMADWSALPGHVRHDIIEAQVKTTREVAANMVMMKYPSIPAAAVAAKRAKATGTDP